MTDESNALPDRLRSRCNAMHEYADSELMCEAAAQIESLTRDIDKYQKRAFVTTGIIDTLRAQIEFLTREKQLYAGDCLSLSSELERNALRAELDAAKQTKVIATYPAIDDTNRYEEALFRYADRIEKGMPYLRNSTTDKFCKDIIDDMRSEAIASIRNAQGSLGEALQENTARSRGETEETK